LRKWKEVQEVLLAKGPFAALAAVREHRLPADWNSHWPEIPKPSIITGDG
jgi:hypothetical protein